MLSFLKELFKFGGHVMKARRSKKAGKLLKDVNVLLKGLENSDTTSINLALSSLFTQPVRVQNPDHPEGT